MADNSDITITETKGEWFVWVTGNGPTNSAKRIRRLIAAHSRKNGYGTWVSAGGSYSPEGCELRVAYANPEGRNNG